MGNSILDQIYNINNDIWGEPQTYKNIPFYPLMIYQREAYEDFYTLFTFNKDQVPDKNIGKMSYLKFLICILPNIYKKDIKNILVNFLKIITKTENVKIYDNRSNEDKIAVANFLSMLSGEEVNSEDLHYEFFTLEQLNKLKFFITINNIKFSEYDFDVIREIILQQYDLNLDYIRSFDPTLEENLRILHKGSDVTFEEHVFAFSALMKIPICEIKNTFTIYQFNKTIERLHMVEDYESLKGLESAGFIKLKKGEIAHWLSHVPKRGRYDDLLVKKEDFIKNNDIFKASSPKNLEKRSEING
jgi:hypothetical protein